MTFHVTDPYGSETGFRTESMTSVWEYRPESAYAHTPNSKYGSTVEVIRRYKSSTVPGITIRLPSAFRKATAYSRLIQRIDPVTKGPFYNRWYGTGYRYVVVDDPRHSSGVAMAFPPKCNWQNGAVYVSYNVEERAKSEAYSKLLDSKLNVGVALAESRQTLNFLSTMVSRLVRAYRAFRSGNLVKAFRLLRVKPRERLRYEKRLFPGAASKAWLEYQYAFMPLISDIFGAYQLFVEGLRRQKMLLHVERTVRSPISTSSFVASGLLDRSTISGSAEESAKVTYWFQIDGGILPILSELGLTNPLLIAWELVPFSFVIDWVLPIGAVLETLTATQGVSYVDGHVVRQVHASLTVVNNNPGPSTAVFSHGTKPSAKISAMYMQRFVYGSFPWVTPYVKSPFSTSHALSALALLKGLKR